MVENGPRALKLNAVKSSVLCTGTTSRAARVLTRRCNVSEVPSVPRLFRDARATNSHFNRSAIELRGFNVYRAVRIF